MHRPAVVIGAAALLSLAACGSAGSSGSTASGGSSPTATAAASSARALDGTQGYGAVVDLYGDRVGGSLQCGGLSPQVDAPLVEQQATCTTAAGKPLALQIWADAASRDSGVAQLAQAAKAAGQPFCTVAGTGPKAAWSVAAGADQADCTAAATALGGRTVTG